MIDIHSHMLSGADDGAKNLEMSAMMAEQALENGINAVIATPHHLKGTFFNPGEKVKQLVRGLATYLKEKNINLSVYPGQEVRLHAEIGDGLKDGSILPLAGSRYILIELPTNQIPLYTESIFFDLQSSGYIPIIAHPERNIPIMNDLSILERFIDNGCLAQLTWNSFSGGFGYKTANISKKMIKNHLVQFIATDAHNTKKRSFELPYKKMASKKWRNLLTPLLENGKYILENKPLDL